MVKATLFATLTAPPSPRSEELAALSKTVDCLEVRADLTGDIDPDWLRSRFRGRLLYALRSRAEGGEFESSNGQRRERILKAARHYDLIDMEGSCDLLPDLLVEIPPRKRLISWHGRAEGVNELRGRFEGLSAVNAKLYRLVSKTERLGDELAPLSLLKSLGRSDTIAYAEGNAGFWSRMVAPHLGAPAVFGAVEKSQANDGEPTITQLIEDYGLPWLPPLESIYGIVGNPVSHSLSPRLHNAAYRILGRPALYVPFHVESFSDYWREVVEAGTLEELGISIRGLTVVSPYKEAALGMAGTRSPLVSRAGSTNLFVRNNGIWKADTTDPEGVLIALAERGVQVKNRRAAVIGCGGSGRAVAAALDQKGAQVIAVNRGMERGRLAVELLGLPFMPLSEFSAEGFSIIVNATPVGRDDDRLPFGIDDLEKDAVIVDLVYGSGPTPLVSAARALGHVAIDGWDVLLTQVRRQFLLMIGQEMPECLTREALIRQAERSIPARVNQ